MSTKFMMIFFSGIALFAIGCNEINSEEDVTSPQRSNLQPTGALPSGTTVVTLSLDTDENATCRYDTTSNKTYDAMSQVFTKTGSQVHESSVSGLLDSTTYAYYIRCQDKAGNTNTDDLNITFSIQTMSIVSLNRSNARPVGTQPSGTTTVTLSLQTDVNATCRYDTVAGKEYDTMAQVFSTTGTQTHESSVSGLMDGTTYTYYVRCRDEVGNTNTDDLNITFSIASPGASTGGFSVNHTHTDLSLIPNTWVDKAKEILHIAYNHTSHGSQLITGMNALKSYPDFNDKYDWSDATEGNTDSLSLDDRGMPSPSDLSQGDGDDDGDGVANWAETTYTYLADPGHYHVNVIMWSWCNISGHDIDRYLYSMEWLIAQFGEGGSHARATDHPVKFVFMTAHANGGGENDSSDTPNKQIRTYVAAHNHILFDFSDIENYDPDNNYFLDKQLNDTLNYDNTVPYDSGSRDANWASEYLVRHDGGERDKLTHGEGVAGYSGTGSCAHSNEHSNDARLNCVLKGQGVWYLFARLAGWNGQ